MTPELSLAYADLARLTERVRELEAALEQIAACDTIETWDPVDIARAALAKREGG